MRIEFRTLATGLKRLARPVAEGVSQVHRLDGGLAHLDGLRRHDRSTRTVRAVLGISLVFVAIGVAGLFSANAPSASHSSASPLTRDATPTFPTPIHHVVTVVLENNELSTVQSQGPYEMSLLNGYSGTTQYYAACHPSAPEYLAMTSGQMFQCGTDAFHTYGAENVADVMDKAGVTWKAYLENMPSPCDASNSGAYDINHNPFPWYSDLGSACPANDLPFTSWNPSQSPPAYVFVAPNRNDDAHDTNVSVADHWVKTFMKGGTMAGSNLQGWPGILNEPWFSSTVVFFVYDEGTNRGGYAVSGVSNSWCNANGASGLSVCGGNVYFSAVSPYTQAVGPLSVRASHYSYLETVEWLLGLSCTGTGLDCNSGFPALKGMFNVSAPAPLTVSASATPSSGTAPLNVQFSATASGGTTPYSYAWTFGDGSQSSAQNPTHSYGTAGKYTAVATVTDARSSAASQSLGINVTSTNPGPSVNVSSNVTSGTVPLTVGFRSSVTGGSSPYTYHWRFGDGGTSTAANPSHTFTKTGTFTVDLTVDDSAGHNATANVTIQVSAGGSPLTVSASANQTGGPAPLLVGFSATASGGQGAYRFSWAFGDGGTSSQPDPAHTYVVPGSYTSSVVVADGQGNHAQANVTINVGAPLLSVTIDANPVRGVASQWIAFHAAVIAGTSPFAIVWGFGDGTAGATGANVSHRFDRAGVYNVSASVTDAAQRTAVAKLRVTIFPSFGVSIAGLPSSTTVEVGETVQLQAAVTGGTAPYAFQWQLNGSTIQSQEGSVSWEISGYGVYQFSVTVTDAAGAQATNVTTFTTVSPPPPASPPGGGGTTFGFPSALLETALVGVLFSVVLVLTCLSALSWRDLRSFRRGRTEGRHGTLGTRIRSDGPFYGLRR